MIVKKKNSMVYIEFNHEKKNKKEKFFKGITPFEILKEKNLVFSQKITTVIFNNKVIEINSHLEKNGFLEIVTEDSEKSNEILQHSAAHLMSHAIQRMFPQSLLVDTSILKEGFYCDFDFQQEKISEKNFSEIEKKMYKITQENLKILKKEINFKEAFNLFEKNKYKQKKIKKNSNIISFCFQGEFYDLCDQIHLSNTNELKFWKILKISGSYLDNNFKKKNLTRIYGIAFYKKEDYEKYLNLIAERKERDHKKINKKYDFFMFSKEVGIGLPFWLHKGAVIRRVIENYIIDKEIQNDYQHVYTPILANTKLYEISGHLKLYKEHMFPIMNIKNEEKLVLRPMNCPHHMMIFKKKIHSYKELPIRIAELGMMHRYEHSGAVSGLQRTREMTLNDAHIFLKEEQIKEEFKKIIFLILEVYKDFGIKDYFFNLSTRDIKKKNKYFDDDIMWQKAESYLKEILCFLNIPFKEKIGDAAFYGPKIDIQVLTALGHEETLSTIQLDFLLPKRFQLNYIGEDGKEHGLIIIHRAIVSTMERFVAFLIEQNKGIFPLWLAPIQVILIPINNQKHLEYTEKIKKILVSNNIRTELNSKKLTLNYKIKQSQEFKIPFQVVIGDEEIQNKTLTFRKYADQNLEKNISIENFIKTLFKIILEKK
jgi:threonyl-tRNA synthetase